MRLARKRFWAATFLVFTATAWVLWLFSGEPYYRGRRVSEWPVDYSHKLYPTGTSPLSASQRGLEALREMGPQKAAIALVHALMRRDSKLYEQYRSLHPKLPTWFRTRFPLRLTHQEEVILILGATEFFEPDYQKAMLPFLFAYLERPDPKGQVAACQVLASMPEVASPALPTLKHLTTSADPSVCEAAQAAVDRITLASKPRRPPLSRTPARSQHCAGENAAEIVGAGGRGFQLSRQ